MKRIILIIMAVLLILPFVSGEPSFVFKDDENINLKIPCLRSDSLKCDATTNCTISIDYPNTESLVKNGTMSPSDGIYNYTITKGRVQNRFGEYPTTIYCENGTDGGLTTFNFEVNADGSRIPITTIIIILFIIIYLMLGLSIYLQNIYIGSVTGMFMMIMGIYVGTRGIGDINNILTITFSIIHVLIGFYILMEASGMNAINLLNNTEEE